MLIRIGFIVAVLGLLLYLASYLSFAAKFQSHMRKNAAKLQKQVDTEEMSEQERKFLQMMIDYQLEHQAGYHPLVSGGVCLVGLGLLLIAIAFFR